MPSTDAERFVVAMLVERHGFSPAAALEWLNRPDPRFAGYTPAEILTAPVVGFPLVMRGLDLEQTDAQAGGATEPLSQGGTTDPTIADVAQSIRRTRHAADVELACATFQEAVRSRAHELLRLLDTASKAESYDSYRDHTVSYVRAGLERLGQPNVAQQFGEVLREVLGADVPVHSQPHVNQLPGGIRQVMSQLSVTTLTNDIDPITRAVIAWAAAIHVLSTCEICSQE